MRHYLCVILTLCLTQVARAQSTGQFEVVDLTGTINGEPQLSLEAARNSWNNACREWKNETKGLNKNNELLGINCNTPSCSSMETGRTQCSSTGTYQVKTAGVRVVQTAAPPTVQAVPAAAPEIVTVAQPAPQIIVEPVPAPRIGFYWVPGYWGWFGHRHIWHGGHWHRRW